MQMAAATAATVFVVLSCAHHWAGSATLNEAASVPIQFAFSCCDVGATEPQHQAGRNQSSN